MNNNSRSFRTVATSLCAALLAPILFPVLGDAHAKTKAPTQTLTEQDARFRIDARAPGRVPALLTSRDYMPDTQKTAYIDKACGCGANPANYADILPYPDLFIAMRAVNIKQSPSGAEQLSLGSAIYVFNGNEAIIVERITKEGSQTPVFRFDAYKNKPGTDSSVTVNTTQEQAEENVRQNKQWVAGMDCENFDFVNSAASACTRRDQPHNSIEQVMAMMGAAIKHCNALIQELRTDKKLHDYSPMWLEGARNNFKRLWQTVTGKALN